RNGRAGGQAGFRCRRSPARAAAGRLAHRLSGLVPAGRRAPAAAAPHRRGQRRRQGAADRRRMDVGPAMNAVAQAAGWSYWPAPAKLNLFLHVTGRRADGYHELQTVFRLLDWGDRIALHMRDDGQIRRVGASVPGVAEADDLVVRAAIVLQKAAKSSKGADIGVEKRIPAGGGFGGGSSDAATVLVALNALWGTGLDE